MIPPKTLTPGALISEILCFMHQNCGRCDLSLALLSKEANLSSRHLGRLFHKRTGRAFREYLREIRLQRAAELLIEHNDVKATAGLVGYSSRTRFDHDFRARFGYTPAQFKKVRAAA